MNEFWSALAGGGLALSGVVVAELLARARDRRIRYESAFHDLAFIYPLYLACFSGRADTPSPTPLDEGFQTDFWQIRERVFRSLAELRTLPRWPNRRAHRIRSAADDVAARWAAIELRFGDGRPASPLDMLNSSLSPLRRALLGDEPTLDTLVRKYRQEGIPDHKDD